jgi:uncharacterized 2Fe-2S/4Fe-4S cluster protein (DUF4445 family)
MDVVMEKIKKGELIDVSSAIDSDHINDKNNFLDLYVKSVSLKYPIKPFKTLDKLILMKSISPMLIKRRQK